jgi:hypothetical protein
LAAIGRSESVPLNSAAVKLFAFKFNALMMFAAITVFELPECGFFTANRHGFRVFVHP